MKHTFQITLILISIFLASQIIGLTILNQYFSYDEQQEITYEELPLNIERPDVEEEFSWIIIFIGILIGTILLLLLIKLRARYITKTWFFLAVFIGLTFAFSAFMQETFALILALIIAGWKIFYPNPYIHNLSEIFVYGGIAVLFHEMLSIRVAVILIIAISIYDMIAVWKIKHMITLAKFQTEQKIFAGAMIPYNFFQHKSKQKPNTKSKGKAKIKKTSAKNAILGGGDMAFPLFLAGAVLKEFNFLMALIPVIGSTIALSMLFFKASKNKFYPAMPFIAAGSFIGLIIVYLI